MRTLVLCDDRWHPARVPREGVSALQDRGFAFDWIENASEWTAELMLNYQLVVLTKSNHVSFTDHREWMTDESQAAFVDYVRRGNGLLAIHSGTAGYQETPVLRNLLGGVFMHHPEQCEVTMDVDANHPMTVGAPPFTIQDEHYFMAMGDHDVDIFMTTRSGHGHNVHVQPGGWCRSEGAGRVAVLTPGHNLEVWLHPSYQALILNALRWCGKIR